MTVICTAERNGTNMIRKEITISDISHKNMANLIHIACIFDSDIILENSRSRINAKSLMGVMAFSPTDEITMTITATGKDELEALSAIEDFFIKKIRF